MKDATLDKDSSETELREKFSSLAHLHEPEILRHAMRLCNGNWEWARDLTQDALIAGYRLALEGKLDFSGNVKGWFIRVVTTRYINEYNRKKRWQSDVEIDKVDGHLSMSAVQDMTRSEGPDLSQVFDEPLEMALRQLPDDQRLCVLLIDVEEFSYQEASDHLQVPVGTVRSRLARARIKLYSLLQPYALARGLI